MRTAYDAVIIGAGPAGSTAAVLLARAGWSVALVEKQCFPRRKVCGECIAASNLPLLDALGISCAFEASAGPALRQLALMRGRHAIVAGLPPAADSNYRWGHALGRETLDSLLLERARAVGAQVLQPWSVRAIEGTLGDWRLEVRARGTDPTWTLRAPVVIDAHGSWEGLAAGHPQALAAHKPSDLLAFKANFRNAALADGMLPVLSFDGGYGGMVMADGGLATVACCIRRDRVDAIRACAPGASAGDAVEAMLKRQCSGVASALQGAVRIGSWLAAGPIHPGIRLGRYGTHAGRKGDGPFCIGNAAGEAHPILGEGMSMALQSAQLLCERLLDDGHQRAASKGATAPGTAPWRLADGRRAKAPGAGAQREAGRAYAAEWRRQFEPRMRLAAVFAQLAMRPGPAQLLVALARCWPGLLTAGARWGGKTSVPRSLRA